MIFDLDGTLVKTERLKANSYAKAAVELCPDHLNEAEVVESFKDVVGLSRREVATALMERFDLRESAERCMAECAVSTPWQAFVQIRLHIYEAMLADPETLSRNQWPHSISLLREARRNHCSTALATMSHCEQAQRVLDILNLTDSFNFVATRDDVERGKPDPEIYSLVSRELDIPAGESLVIEDSLAGVKAAIAAGMWCIVVTTPFTRQAVHAEGLLDERWTVDDPNQLEDAVRQMIVERGHCGHRSDL